MRIQVLGCSGGIGDGRHTTSFLIDDDILLDAGSGVTTLSRDALRRIDHVFLTHTHLDHILSLPLLLDSVAGERDQPVLIHAIDEVLDILKAHLFNWRIWPDFSGIPTEASPFMRYAPLRQGETVQLGARAFTAVPACHVIPAVGYLLRGEHGSVLFSGDTASHEAFWQVANATDDLRHLWVECSFGEDQADIALASKHYCSRTLANDLAQLRAGPEVWVSHLKPGGEALIMAELASMQPRALRVLEQGAVFDV